MPRRRASPVFAPPGSATEQTHKFQSVFLKVVEGEMPDNNKLDPDQELILNEEVIMSVFQTPAQMQKCFLALPGDVYGEEQHRPVVNALINALVSVVHGKEKIIVKEGPVAYYVKLRADDGTIYYKEVFPPGEKARAVSEGMSTSISHDDLRGKKWKKDSTILSQVSMVDDFHDLVKIWVPRILIEAKGGDASFLDLYQASTNTWKQQLLNLLNGLPISRMYFEVWGIHNCFYGIQDVFGYLTVEQGKVTKRSFEKYLKNVDKMKKLWGPGNFPDESFQKCPKTLEEVQSMYDRVSEEYENKYHAQLPSQHGISDFPIGIVYLDPRPMLFPCGSAPVTLSSMGCFLQGHIRILASNWLIPEEPTEYQAANNRLLENELRFNEEAREMIKERIIEKRRRTKLPGSRVYKTLEEAGAALRERYPNWAAEYHEEGMHNREDQEEGKGKKKRKKM